MLSALRSVVQICNHRTNRPVDVQNDYKAGGVSSVSGVRIDGAQAETSGGEQNLPDKPSAPTEPLEFTKFLRTHAEAMKPDYFLRRFSSLKEEALSDVEDIKTNVAKKMFDFYNQLCSAANNKDPQIRKNAIAVIAMIHSELKLTKSKTLDELKNSDGLVDKMRYGRMLIFYGNTIRLLSNENDLGSNDVNEGIGKLEKASDLKNKAENYYNEALKVGDSEALVFLRNLNNPRKIINASRVSSQLNDAAQNNPEVSLLLARLSIYSSDAMQYYRLAIAHGDLRGWYGLAKYYQLRFDEPHERFYGDEEKIKKHVTKLEKQFVSRQKSNNDHGSWFARKKTEPAEKIEAILTFRPHRTYGAKSTEEGKMNNPSLLSQRTIAYLQNQVELGNIYASYKLGELYLAKLAELGESNATEKNLFDSTVRGLCADSGLPDLLEIAADPVLANLRLPRLTNIDLAALIKPLEDRYACAEAKKKMVKNPDSTPIESTQEHKKASRVCDILGNARRLFC